METRESIENRTLTLKRKISVPPSAVWEAWTNPGHIAQWWAPEGLQVNIAKHDFSIGGRWRFRVEMHEGETFVSEGTFLDIEPRKKFVTSADFTPMTIGVVLQVLFEGDGNGGTRLEFHILHPTAAYRNQQQEKQVLKGWNAAFNRLENYLLQSSGKHA